MSPRTLSSSLATGPGIGPVRNHIGWRDRLARFRGSSIHRDLRGYDRTLDEINAIEPELVALTDDELCVRGRRLRDQARAGSMDDVRAGTFALVRELARRRLGLRPFDEQLVAGLAMDRGAVVEMQTGEGKTLAAVLPVALNALARGGVHVLTFNDYLARRDAEWMEPIYTGLGLTVAYVQHGMTPAIAGAPTAPTSPTSRPRRPGSTTCATCWRPTSAAPSMGRVRFALVDEADSLLIDEARIPLVIAGSIGRAGISAARLTGLVSGARGRRALRPRRVRPRRRAHRAWYRASRAGTRRVAASTTSRTWHC